MENMDAKFMELSKKILHRKDPNKRSLVVIWKSEDDSDDEEEEDDDSDDEEIKLLQLMHSWKRSD